MCTAFRRILQYGRSKEVESQAGAVSKILLYLYFYLFGTRVAVTQPLNGGSFIIINNTHISSWCASNAGNAMYIQALFLYIMIVCFYFILLLINTFFLGGWFYKRCHQNGACRPSIEDTASLGLVAPLAGYLKVFYPAIAEPKDEASPPEGGMMRINLVLPLGDQTVEFK